MSELVARTGVPAATVRYYMVQGLLPPAVRVSSNRYLYDERHVEAVRLVRLLRERRSMSLETIARVLPELLPDLLGTDSPGVFRPEMWGEVLVPGAASPPGPSLRDRLVDIGTEQFSARGYGEVTVDDVCRAADIAKGSFYRQFSSKEELFLAVVQTVATRSAERFSCRAAGRLVAPAEAVGALADALGTHLAVVLDLTSLAAQRRPGYAHALRALTATLCAAVEPVLAPRVATSAGEPVPADAPARAAGTTSADEVVARAVFEGVRRAVIGEAGEAPVQLDGGAGPD